MTLSAPVKLPMLRLDELTEEDKNRIHRATEIAVVSASIQRPLTADWKELLGPLADQYVFGLFTTLSRCQQLRGCCGFLGRPTLLADAIFQAAARTVRDDVRMTPISPAEVAYLKLDVSILGTPVALKTSPTEREDAIQIGKHGLRISRDNQVGLLLPSVASEQNWDAKQFLHAVCRKAGMHEAAWQDPAAVLEVFDGIVIEGAIQSDSLPSNMPVVLPPGTVQQLQRLKQVVSNNLIAFTQGGTPSYVALDALDGTVTGIVLTLRDADNDRPLANWIQTSLRPGVPLQSSLVELTKNAADTLTRTRFERKMNIDVEVTVLFDPIHHGIVEFNDWTGNELHESLPHCDTKEVRADGRAIVALSGERCAVSFDANKSVHQLVTESTLPLRLRKNPVAVFSMQCMSTCNSLMATNAPIAVDRDDVRAPALAGTFYPESRAERSAIVDGMRSSPAPTQRKALGLMTPHAGLRYSGPVATKVWEQVELPSSLLILGPKHTPHGVDWALSPNQSWQIPDGEDWATNLELTKAIANGVEGMELDLAAHLVEHSIEIQLPILEALLSNSVRPSIAAAVFRGATWDEIAKLSEQLAQVLRDLPELPLMVISSDMNHFLPVAETVRRDQIALEAMESGDPRHLLETCRAHQITMCGVVPAAIVMQTLIHLGKPFQVERVAHETSADHGGDPQRVVGYAGALLLPK